MKINTLISEISQVTVESVAFDAVHAYNFFILYNILSVAEA